MEHPAARRGRDGVLRAVSENLFERVLADPVAEGAFSDTALIAGMLSFEVALAQAQARVGVIPYSAAGTIRDHAASFSPDTEQLLRDGAHAGSLAIPFVKSLKIGRAHV